MTWRRALLYWAGFGVLALYYLGSTHHAARHSAGGATRAPFIVMPPAEIIGIELRRGGARIHCRLTAGRWQVVEPPAANVPPDLVAALISNLTELPDVEVVAEQSEDVKQFGLEPPAAELTLTPADGAPVSVRIGVRNPAGTAVYAQRGDSPRVFLIGLNALYYQDLLFESAGRQSAGREK